MLHVKDRVTIPGIGTGWIAKIYPDCDGGNITVVMMDDPKATGNGFYLARDCEMKPEVQEPMFDMDGGYFHHEPSEAVLQAEARREAAREEDWERFGLDQDPPEEREMREGE